MALEGIRKFLDQYDLTEIFNPINKKLVEKKMGKKYKRIYYTLQYSREILMVLGLISLIIWIIIKNINLLICGISFWITAGLLAVITQKMRKFIAVKYNIN